MLKTKKEKKERVKENKVYLLHTGGSHTPIGWPLSIPY